MSTQAARSILFTHTTPQQGFKLLELPPDLADQLTSKEPPTYAPRPPITDIYSKSPYSLSLNPKI
jgi:sister chromatid cohesion protein DCC1